MKNNTSPHRALCLNQGFSAFELIIVMGTIGILIAIAIPNLLAWMPEYRLKKVAGDLYADMQLTRFNAIKKSKTWAIVFDSTKRRYTLCSDQGSDNSWAIAHNTIEKDVFFSGQDGVGFGHGNATKDATIAGGTNFGTNDITFTSDVATFNNNGMGKSGYIYLENKNKSTYAIGQESTGFIKIKKWNGTDWK